MGLLFVFFSDHYSTNPPAPPPFSLQCSKSSNFLLSKAQSTISICLLLLFLTLFLFTISTFEPSSVTSRIHRRFLLNRDVCIGASKAFALQGLGTLFLKGTRGMHDLVVAHVASNTTEDDFRLFLRLLHRTGIFSHSDVVLLFNSTFSISRFSGLIEEENNSFFKLVEIHRNFNSWNRTGHELVWGFNVTRFVKNRGKKEMQESLWGKKKRKSNVGSRNETESLVMSHGSVVGFEMNELDPENSLSWFMDQYVPMNLRRWVCYPMLLGRLRHNFKHVMLVYVKTFLFLGDPFTRLRNRSSDSVLFFSLSKHSKTSSNSVVNSAILMGGDKGIRRLSSAMLTEIVRYTIQHKKRNSVSETAVLSQIVGNRHVTKNFQVIVLSESVMETSSLVDPSLKYSDIIPRGNHNIDINAIITKFICSCELDSSVY